MVALETFSRKHPAARRPLQRFLEVAEAADWPHLMAMKNSFRAADYTSSGMIIFNIAGNKYRLAARVDFNERIMYVESVLTHEEYRREVF